MLVLSCGYAFYFSCTSTTAESRANLANLISCDGRVALPRGAFGLSAVCDCGIS